MENFENLANSPSEPTEEEKKEEAEALKEAKDDEIRNKVITDYGLDEDIDAELIEKIVKTTSEHKKALSTAIRQKIDWRAKVPKEEPKKKDEIKALTPEELDARLDERDRKREIDAIEVSDELKKEIASYAKLHGLSVKKTFESEYIQFLKKKEDDKKQEEEASVGGISGTRAIKDLSKITTPRKAFDLSTKEGQERYEEWKKINRKTIETQQIE